MGLRSGWQNDSSYVDGVHRFGRVGAGAAAGWRDRYSRASAPDSTPRSIDAIDLAWPSKTQRMRGLVLKNHYEPTASLAYIVRKEVPGIEIFGGIDLNLSVGGMNPTAVEHMAAITGGYGRFGWMATFDPENQVRFSKENRPFVRIARDEQLLPETKAVIAVIANMIW